MKIKSIWAVVPLLTVSVASPAWANGSCSPAKKLVQAVKAFSSKNMDLTNVISPSLSVGLKGINGHPDPTHMLYKYEDVEHKLKISEGQVQRLETAENWSEKGALCSAYTDIDPPESDEPTVTLSVSFEFPFQRRDGVFSYEEIKEGAKDGSKIIKSLAPSGLGFAAPSLKTFAVMPGSDSNVMPELSFSKQGKSVEVASSYIGSTRYIRLKDIKASKADALKIIGPYRAFAFFKINPEEMAKTEAKRVADLEAVED